MSTARCVVFDLIFECLSWRCSDNFFNIKLFLYKIEKCIDFLFSVPISYFNFRVKIAHDPATKNLDIDAVRNLYGSGLAMHLMTERRLAAAAGGRLPGMDATPDCNAMLDAVTGNDVEMDFDDVLNRVEFRPEGKFRSVHSKMESKFGLI